MTVSPRSWQAFKAASSNCAKTSATCGADGRHLRQTHLHRLRLPRQLPSALSPLDFRVEKFKIAAEFRFFSDHATLNPSSDKALGALRGTNDNRIVWIDEIDGKAVYYLDEPMTGPCRRLKAWFLGWLVSEAWL